MSCPICGPNCVVFTRGQPSTIETTTVEMKSFVVYPSMHRDDVDKLHKVSYDLQRFTPDPNARVKNNAFHQKRVSKYGRGEVHGR